MLLFAKRMAFRAKMVAFRRLRPEAHVFIDPLVPLPPPTLKIANFGLFWAFSGFCQGEWKFWNYLGHSRAFWGFFAILGIFGLFRAFFGFQGPWGVLRVVLRGKTQIPLLGPRGAWGVLGGVIGPQGRSGVLRGA